jgi:hypothetical protein
MYYHSGKNFSLQVTDPEQKFRKFQKKAGKRKKERNPNHRMAP